MDPVLPLRRAVCSSHSLLQSQSRKSSNGEPVLWGHCEATTGKVQAVLAAEEVAQVDPSARPSSVLNHPHERMGLHRLPKLGTTGV